MKSTILIVLGGLLFAGTALAAEPQAQTTGNSMKIAIDAKTGKLRALTAQESAALDAQATKLAAKSRGTMAKGGVLSAPATYADSVAGGVSKNGLIGYLAPVESLSSLTATIDSAGKMTLLENGKPMQHAEELASE